MKGNNEINKVGVSKGLKVSKNLKISKSPKKSDFFRVDLEGSKNKLKTSKISGINIDDLKSVNGPANAPPIYREFHDFLRLSKDERTRCLNEMNERKLIDLLIFLFGNGKESTVSSNLKRWGFKYSDVGLAFDNYFKDIKRFSDIRLNTFVVMLACRLYNCHTVSLSLDYFYRNILKKKSYIIAIPLEGFAGFFAPHTFNCLMEGKKLYIVDVIMGFETDDLWEAEYQETEGFKTGGCLGEWIIYEPLNGTIKTLSDKKAAVFLGKGRNGSFIDVSLETFNKLENIRKNEASKINEEFENIWEEYENEKDQLIKKYGKESKEYEKEIRIAYSKFCEKRNKLKESFEEHKFDIYYDINTSVLFNESGWKILG